MNTIQQNSGQQVNYDSPNRQRLSHRLVHPVQPIAMRSNPVQLGIPSNALRKFLVNYGVQIHEIKLQSLLVKIFTLRDRELR